MNSVLSWFFFFAGIFWGFAGKPLLEVCACFLVCAVFDVSYQISEIKKEMEDWEEDET